MKASKAKLQNATSKKIQMYINILFKDGFAFATNGGIIVANDLKEYLFLSSEQCEALNGKSINGDNFKYILNAHSLEINHDGIVCIGKKGVSILIPFVPNNSPVFKSVIPEKIYTTFENVKIKLTPKYLMNIIESMHLVGYMVFSVSSNGGIIKITDSHEENKSFAIILNVMS